MRDYSYHTESIIINAFEKRANIHFNEKNKSTQYLQEQMAFFQQQRDLFLRIQRQARETSTAKARGTAVTEGSERKKSDSLKKPQPCGRRRSKEAGEIDTSHSTDTESEGEAECSIKLINVPRHDIGKS